MILFRIALFAAGMFIVFRTLLSAMLTFVLPRAVTDRLTRFVFLRVRQIFLLASLRARTYAETDRIWALFAPTALLALPVVWVVMVFLGFGAMYWAEGMHTWREALTLSGSSLLTLGFAVPSTVRETAMAFSEATIGLGLIATLVAYLPTIYSAWSRREGLVTLLETRAGTPPTPAEMFVRYSRLERMDSLNDLWTQWEAWFADVEESHTSLAALSLFRSSHPDRSWVVAAGCVLDAASLATSTLDIRRDPQAAITIRAGMLALQRLCSLFQLPYISDPHYPANPIAVTREEFDAVCDRLAAAGVPLLPDRDQAWIDFAGWRVNYDTVLRSMAGLTLAPSAPWSGDRPIRYPHTRG